jgi:hypothetical protein
MKQTIRLRVATDGGSSGGLTIAMFTLTTASPYRRTAEATGADGAISGDASLLNAVVPVPSLLTEYFVPLLRA